MNRSLWHVSLFVMSMPIAACYATALSQDRFGGEIVVADRSESSMDDAKDLMLDHCGPDNYRIDGWDTVVVDVEGYQTSDVDKVQNPDGSGHTTSETRTGTDEKTEIHLYYSCLQPTSPDF